MQEAKLVVVSLRITPTLKRMVDRAARRSGLGFNDWTRAVLARAANEGAFAPPRAGHTRSPISPIYRSHPFTGPTGAALPEAAPRSRLTLRGPSPGMR